MKESAIAQITVTPLGTETASLSRYVAACLDIVKQSRNINYQLTAMGTIIQGPLEQIIGLVQEMHEAPFTLGARRVVTTITIDDRRDKQITMESKVKSVTQRLT